MSLGRAHDVCYCMYVETRGAFVYSGSLRVI